MTSVMVQITAEEAQMLRAMTPDRSLAYAVRRILRSRLAQAQRSGVMAVAQSMPGEQGTLLQLRAEQNPRRRQELLARLIRAGRWDRQMASLCRKWRSDGVLAEDLRAAALEGLLEAIKRWHPGHGWRTFAFRWIEYCLSECVRLFDAGAVGETQREIRQRKKTGGEARSRSWTPINEEIVAGDEEDREQQIDLCRLRRRLDVLPRRVREALLLHFEGGKADAEAVARGMALLKGMMR